MDPLRLVLSTVAFIASCHASGLHVAPVLRSFPIVRYAPFYNFPNTVRSIHAVSPAFPAVAPAFPAPLAPAPVLPAPAPVLPAPAPVFAAPPPVLPAPGPLFHPYLRQFAPAPPLLAPAAPVFNPAPVFARALPVAHAVPFAPIVRAVAPAFPAIAPALPTPVFTSAPHIAYARALPHVHVVKRVISPVLSLPHHHIKSVAWK